MALKQRIDEDLKAALLERHQFVTQVLRGLKAVILDEEIAQGKREDGLSDAEIEKIVAREVKKRNEAAALYDQNLRQDSADDERREADILAKYLPEQMTEAEIKTIVDAKVAELGATDMKMMGQVIAAVKSDAGSAADGAVIAKIVKQKLS